MMATATTTVFFITFARHRHQFRLYKFFKPSRVQLKKGKNILTVFFFFSIEINWIVAIEFEYIDNFVCVWNKGKFLSIKKKEDLSIYSNRFYYVSLILFNCRCGIVWKTFPSSIFFFFWKNSNAAAADVSAPEKKKLTRQVRYI
jgi:hypothetical protein